ncbi:MAG: hypothetical protein NE328_00355 [Lentisphaeraceae bacterium]|nr:hypothetical protein [Lentisphaeraceae bacterium]
MTEPEESWEDYYAHIIARRKEEASALWGKMEDDGVSQETFLALDFVHFSKNKDDLNAMAKQLSKNYEITIALGKDKYWFLRGTTRPYGIKLTKDSFLSWIDFMCKISQSYASVFSTWAAEAPALKKKWSNSEE